MRARTHSWKEGERPNRIQSSSLLFFGCFYTHARTRAQTEGKRVEVAVALCPFLGWISRLVSYARAHTRTDEKREKQSLPLQVLFWVGFRFFLHARMRTHSLTGGEGGEQDNIPEVN